MNAAASGAVPNDPMNTATDARADTGATDPTTTGAPDPNAPVAGGAVAGGAVAGDAVREADADGATANMTDLPADPEPVPDSGQVSTGTGAAAPSLLGSIALYTVLRLALVIVLTAVLMLFMPLIVALMFAIVVQLPLSWLLFSGPRRRVNEAIALASAQRRAERARLQAALTGDDFID